MAERVTASALAEAGVAAQLSSAGISDEEQGRPMDRRARRVLTTAGYDAENHRAHQLSADEASAADLIVAAEQFHLDRLRPLVGAHTRLALVSDFDPQASRGEPLPDPWYGDESDFVATLEVLERATPGMVRAITELG